MTIQSNNIRKGADAPIGAFARKTAVADRPVEQVVTNPLFNAVLAAKGQILNRNLERRYDAA